MAEEQQKKQKKCNEGAPEYMVTYGDLMSLLLTFFIMLLSAAKIEGQELRLIFANFPGLGNLLGGQSFNEGRLPFSGQIKEALPSLQQGRSFEILKSESLELLQSDENRKQVRITKTERGLVVSLATDFFFEKYSATFNLDTGVDLLRRASALLRRLIEDNPSLSYTIEGYTDETGFPAGSPYVDEWGLSTARAVAILRILEQFLVPTETAKIVGMGNNYHIYQDEGIGSSFNRRVDIVIINDGNL